MMRIALHKVRSGLGNYVIIHVKSSLPQDYSEQIQAYLEAGKYPECSFYDPTFPWDTAEVGLLYFGLREEEDQWTVQLPDGRTVRVWNLNPGSKNQMTTAFDFYSRAMDAARNVLLSGGTAEDAVDTLSKCCKANPSMSNSEFEPLLRLDLLDEMEEYRELLLEDARWLGIKTEACSSENPEAIDPQPS